MSVKEINKEIKLLSAAELDEVAAFLATLRGESGSSDDLQGFLQKRVEEAERAEFSRRSVPKIWADLRASRTS